MSGYHQTNDPWPLDAMVTALSTWLDLGPIVHLMPFKTFSHKLYFNAHRICNLNKLIRNKPKWHLDFERDQLF